MNPIAIRIGLASDAQSISALAIQVFLDTYASHGVRPDLANEAFCEYGEVVFKKRLAQPERVFYLAYSGDGLLGFAEIWLNSIDSPIASFGGAELVRLYVQPQAQKSGLGRLLIQATENAVKHAGLGALWLSAWVNNANALAFYSHLGYQDVGLANYVIQGQSFENRILYKAVSPR
jgi:diamine N-acetyltransferase